MPFVFGIFGVLLIVAGVRGTTSQLFGLIKSDFTGQPNYFEWMIAIFLVGALGYIDELKTLSRLFMFLLVLGLLWEKRQVLTSFVSQDVTATSSAASSSTAALNAAVNATTPSALPALPSLAQLYTEG